MLYLNMKMKNYYYTSLIYTKNYSIWDPGGNPALSSDVGGSGNAGAPGATETCIDRGCEFRYSSNHQNGTDW